MENILINSKQLSVSEVTYNNTPTGLTGAAGINITSAMKNGLDPVIARVEFGDLASGLTGSVPVAHVSFLTNAASFGSTGSIVPFKDRTALTPGATGLTITADDVLAGAPKVVELDKSAFQNKLYAKAAGLTGTPCVQVSIKA